MGDPRGEARVVELLGVPLEAYDVVTVLGLAAYPPLMGRLTPGARREMALKVVRSVLDGGTQVRRCSTSPKSDRVSSCSATLVGSVPPLCCLGACMASTGAAAVLCIAGTDKLAICSGSPVTCLRDSTGT